MTRVLTFADEQVGTVHLMSEGQAPSTLPAQGSVEVPSGATAFLLLQESAPADLGFLNGADPDLLGGLRVTNLDHEGCLRLAEQSGLRQLAVAGPLADDQLKILATHCPEQLDVTLSGPAGEGVAALAGAKGLRLHGQPGAALGALTRSATLASLHFHSDSLTREQLCELAASTHLEHLDIEVDAVVEMGDPDVVSALVDVACGLASLTITLADGSTGISQAVQVAVLQRSPEVTLNGVTYTPAAAARLARKLASA